MNYEEKIKELESRIEALEKIENKRKVKATISIVFKVVTFILIIVTIFFGYKFIKSYYDQFSGFTNISGQNSSDNLKEQLNSFQDLFR